MRLFEVTPHGVEEGIQLADVNGALHVPLLADSDGNSETCLRVKDFEPQTARVVQASLRWNGGMPMLVPEEPGDSNSSALVLIRVPVQQRERSNHRTRNLVERFVDVGEATTRVVVTSMSKRTELHTPYYTDVEGYRSLRIRWDGKSLTITG